MTLEAAFSGDNTFSLLAILLLGFAPGIFWLWFFYRKDKLEPEPKSLVARTFFWGMVVALPVAIVEVLVADPLGVLGAGILDARVLLVVLAAPIIEEYGKFFVVRRTMYDHPEFDEPMDGIVYAAAAALGFASVENVVYLSTAFFSPEEMLEAPRSSRRFPRCCRCSSCGRCSRGRVTRCFPASGGMPWAGPSFRGRVASGGSS